MNEPLRAFTILDRALASDIKSQYLYRAYSRDISALKTELDQVISGVSDETEIGRQTKETLEGIQDRYLRDSRRIEIELESLEGGAADPNDPSHMGVDDVRMSPQKRMKLHHQLVVRLLRLNHQTKELVQLIVRRPVIERAPTPEALSPPDLSGISKTIQEVTKDGNP